MAQCTPCGSCYCVYYRARHRHTDPADDPSLHGVLPDDSAGVSVEKAEGEHKKVFRL